MTRSDTYIQHGGMARFLACLSQMPPVTKACTVIVLAYVVVMVFAPWVAPYGEAEVASPESFAPWDSQFLLGTDQLGRDMLSRLIYAIRNTVSIALIATVLSFLVGVSLGVLAAIDQGWFDEITSRAVEIVMAIPALILALILLSILGSSIPNLILVIALLDSTRSFRLARATALGVVSMDFVEAARSRGEGLSWIVYQEILPNIKGTLLAEFALRFCFVFLSISALSFLGLGIQPPTADLGTMVRENSELMAYGDATVMIPASVIAVLAIAVNFLADWLIHRASGLKD